MKYNMLLFLINSKTRSKFLKSFEPGTAFSISFNPKAVNCFKLQNFAISKKWLCHINAQLLRDEMIIGSKLAGAGSPVVFLVS